MMRKSGNTAAADLEVSPADLDEITAASDRVDISTDPLPGPHAGLINR